MSRQIDFAAPSRPRFTDPAFSIQCDGVEVGRLLYGYPSRGNRDVMCWTAKLSFDALELLGISEEFGEGRHFDAQAAAEQWVREVLS
ncbi:MAG TPA: hypothetical protein VNE67_17230 [Acetobacteraceae bacterium]|nr:hypothetical protein [Stellaceae bacterium]HVB69594.1 hypothetical protein [Acetobacteraceae bacterium]